MATEELERDLAVLAGVAGEPVSVRLLAVALGASEEDTLTAGERLVAAEVVVESGGAFGPGRRAPEDLTGARAGVLAGRLADALLEGGRRGELAGRLLAVAGRADEAAPVLAEAALADPGGPSFVETATAALDLHEQRSVLEPSMEGRLRVLRAARWRAAGRSDEAMEDLEVAVRRLRGADLVDALGFAAAVADDRQQPSKAEVWVAMAELEAARIGATAKLASLLTLHGRELARVGLADEADATLERGLELLATHGTPEQQYRGRHNQAWVLLDRGDIRRAEPAFAWLREHAVDLAGPDAVPEADAYLGRVLFAAGRPDEALRAVEEALEQASLRGMDAPAFIAHLALAEGNLAFERYADALAAAEVAEGLASSHLPAWRNVPLFLKARALTGLGRADEARATAEQALEASPPGIDGWRWRSRLESLLLQLQARWDDRRARAAADLTDELLQARLYGAAAELLLVRALEADDAEAAVQAAALAVQVGSPTLAARAIDAGGLWSEGMAAPVANALHAVDRRIPESWRTAWSELPWVRAGLGVEPSTDPEAAGELQRRLEVALADAGLAATETILSPAQRRARGLAPQRRPRRRPAAVWIPVAAVLGAAAVVVGVALGRSSTPPATTSVTTAPPITASTLPPLEARSIPIPNDFAGTAFYRGDAGRTGVGNGGVDQVEGIYWKRSLGGFVRAAPIVYGNTLFVSTSEGIVYSIDIRTGSSIFEMDTGSRVDGPGLVATVQLDSRNSTTIFFVGNDDGTLFARTVGSSGDVLWKAELHGAITAAPLMVGDLLVVGSGDGHLYALRPDRGEVAWSFPGPGTTVAGGFPSAPAAADGIVYATGADGTLYLVSAADGSLVCTYRPGENAPVVTGPVVSDGVVYVGTELHQVAVLPAGHCSGAVANRFPVYQVDAALTSPPLVDGNRMYLVAGSSLEAYKLDPKEFTPGDPTSILDWVPYNAGASITSELVAADGTVYAATGEGRLAAVNRSDGTAKWTFDAGGEVRAAPAVIPGAVFVATTRGEIWAVGGK